MGLTPLSGTGPGGPESFNPETLLQHFLSNPEEMSVLRQRSPQLAEAIATGDINIVKQAILYHREELMVNL